MKFVLVPILMLLVLLQSFSRWIIMVEYQSNQAFIARTLCENRNRPQLKCNGRCQLMKRWAAEDKAAAGQSGKFRVEEIPMPVDVVLSFMQEPASALVHNDRYRCKQGEAHPRALLRPPAGKNCYSTQSFS
ncbi:MAG: hypothetical protein EOP50_08340 [Sphingobacteriales bacterium]|nr:MAG: hypothetical protein EOP50_08340 [Sphingobacteriales bacterium]